MTVVGNAYVVVHAITTGFEDELRSSLRNVGNAGQQAGNQVGRSFSSGARRGFGDADRQALAVYRSINLLIERSYYLQSAIAAASSIIGSLAGGLYALGAQAAAATPSLIVLPSIISAMGQAALTAKLAFGGLGKAVGGLIKQQKGGGGGGVDRMPSLLRAVSTAEDRLAEAKDRVTKSQERLNKVYETAKNRIEDLKFSAEGAALSEKRAGLELQKARETLARVQDLPPNSRARKEAELAFQEAELNYRMAVDRNQDLKKEVNEVTANGTRSVDEQIKNSEEYKAALEAEEDAIKDRKKAKEELTLAEKELTDYQKGKGRGGGGGAGDPTEGLSKEAAAFAKYIAGLQPKIQELRAAAGKELFPRLEIAIQNLVDNLFPRLMPILEDTGKALGNAAIDFSKVVTEADNLKNLDTVAKTNQDTIEKFGKVTGNLYSVFLSLLSAADPLIRRFTDWIVTLTDGWKTSVEAKNKTGELTDIFNYAGDVAAQLGRILGNLGGAFMEMGRAAAGPGSGGQMILDSFEASSQKFEDFVDKLSQSGRLEEWFRETSKNFLKVLEIITKVGKYILMSGDDAAASSTLQGISNAVDILGEALLRITGNNGFGKFIENFAQFIANFTESSSLKMYFAVLNTALETFNKLMSNEYVARIFIFLAAMHGLRSGLSRIAIVAGRVGQYIRGDWLAIKANIAKVKMFAAQTKAALGSALTFIKTAMFKLGNTTLVLRARLALLAAQQKLTAAATKIAAAVQKAFNLVMAGNPIALTILAIVALIAIVVVMYKKFKWFRDFVHAVWDGIKTAISAVIDWLKTNWPIVLAILLGPFGLLITGIIKNFDAIKTALTTIWEYIGPVILAPFKIAWEAIQIAIDLVGKAFGLLKDTFTTVWPLIKTIVLTPFELAWGAIKIAIDILGTAFTLVKDVFVKVWGVIDELVLAPFKLGWAALKVAIDLLGTAFSAVKTVFETVWSKVIRPLVMDPFKFAVDTVKGAINLLGPAFNVVKDVLYVAFGVINTIVLTPLKKAFEGIKIVIDLVGTAFGLVKTAFSNAWDFIKDILDKFKGLLDKLLGPLDEIVGGLKKIGGFVGKGIGGAFKAITPFAEGGIVTKPTHSLIGEAGPELVLPLSSSKAARRNELMRDAGLVGTINVTVNPSPGMDEVELAHLVSRQLALQLRKGAA